MIAHLRGKLLSRHPNQVIVETIGATRTQTGLTVEAVLDTNQYPTGVRISDAQMNDLIQYMSTFTGRGGG